ncbi:hypothetical protein WDW86_19595 [Bdellovibrionota bacterium FG-2]
MPSVSRTSDDTNGSALKSLNELQDEIRTDNEKTEAKRNARIKDLEAKYKAQLKEQEDKYEKSIAQLRGVADGRLKSVQESNRNELDDLRSQTYNRMSRYNGESADTLQRRVQDLARANESLEQQTSQKLDDAKENYSKRAENLQRDNNDELTRAVNTTRQATQDAYHQLAEENRFTARQNQNQSQQEREEIRADSQKQIGFERDRAVLALKEKDRDFAHRENKNDREADRKIARAQDLSAQDIEKQTRKLTESHADQTQTMRSEVKGLLDAEKHYVKSRAQGTADAIKEFEQENGAREQLIGQSYDTQMAKIRQKAQESDTYYTQLNDENLRTKDRESAKIMSKQKTEDHENNQAVSKRFDENRLQLEGKYKKLSAAAEIGVAAQREGVEKQNQNTLQQQSHTASETLARQRQMDQETIKTLERSLEQKLNSTDIADIPTAYEEQIRQKLETKYSQTAELKDEGTDKQFENLKHQYSGRMSELSHDQGLRETKIQRQSAVDRELDKAQFLDHMRDMETEKGVHTRNLQVDHEKETEALKRNYAHHLERQRKEYDDIIQTLRHDATSRLADVRQEADFSSKLLRREAISKHNEMARNYEKRLADQKMEFDLRHDDHKNELQKISSESGRKMKQSLEESERNHEQRIAQLQQQSKERERTLVQNYENELDKVRRANELLIQKKS